jgi:Uma2 family endonuclease
MPLSAKTYASVVLEDPEGNWELHRGRLREKPPMTSSHNQVAVLIAHFLVSQLDWNEHVARIDNGRVRRTDEMYYVPDVFVVPMRLVRPSLGRTDQLEVYDDPLPLVAEVWSPSTGNYDVDTKIPEYKRRGDLEIWRLHPYERSLIAWRRQPDGTHVENRFDGGAVQLWALPSVTIDLDELFKWT